MILFVAENTQNTVVNDDIFNPINQSVPPNIDFNFADFDAQSDTQLFNSLDPSFNATNVPLMPMNSNNSHNSKKISPDFPQPDTGASQVFVYITISYVYLAFSFGKFIILLSLPPRRGDLLYAHIASAHDARIVEYFVNNTNIKRYFVCRIEGKGVQNIYFILNLGLMV